MKQDYIISIYDDKNFKWNELAIFSGASNKAALFRFLQNLDMRRQFRIGVLGELLGTRRPVKGRKMYDYENYIFCVEVA